MQANQEAWKLESRQDIRLFGEKLPDNGCHDNHPNTHNNHNDCHDDKERIRRIEVNGRGSALQTSLTEASWITGNWQQVRLV